jgi:hypothetical protein
VRICGYSSKPKGVHEQKHLGNTALTAKWLYQGLQNRSGASDVEMEIQTQTARSILVIPSLVREVG